MANAIIDVNTEKATIKVSLDGKNISDVQEVRIYKYISYESKGEDSEVRVEIISGTRDEESGINRTLITTCAKDQVETKDKMTDDLIQMFFPIKQ